ncbi:MAG: MFS transporter [Gemmatimonadota bacterium]
MAAPPDRALLYAAAFLRALATGMAGVLLGLYVAGLGFDPAALGLVVGAGLAGVAAAALAVTVAGDRLGRKRALLALTALGGGGGLAAAAVSDVALLAAACFVGMVNGMGRDRGAALILEQAVLPATASDRERTRVFARYNVLQDAGGALGSLLAALPALLRDVAGLDELGALRAAFGIYALLSLVPALLYLRLSPAVEAAPAVGRSRVSAETRRVLWKICPLFALDSLGGGFLTTALLAFFFHERFGAGAAVVGLLFFGARVANAFSHLGAAWLAGRIGLVNTMVFTHAPSSLLLVTVPFAPSFAVAAVLFLVREGLVEMDVPTRQSYVMAVVRPEERTFAGGVTALVRMVAWAVSPVVAGLFMRGLSLATPLYVGAGMKVLYDALLYVAFRRLRPPEEEAALP